MMKTHMDEVTNKHTMTDMSTRSTCARYKVSNVCGHGETHTYRHCGKGHEDNEANSRIQTELELEPMFSGGVIFTHQFRTMCLEQPSVDLMYTEWKLNQPF